MRWRLILTISLFFWCWYYMPAFGEEAVFVQANPRNGMFPLTVRVLLRVQPHADNRMVCLNWGKAGEDMMSRSCWEVAGASAPKSYWFYRHLREPGKWVFVGQVITSDEKSKTNYAVVDVIGGF